VEGTGSYGAALARFLAANGQVVLEVNRPDRQTRRRRGKSDPTDAEAAARAVQAGQATLAPKAGTGQVEMIRVLRVTRQTAIRARTQASNALKALLVTAPAELREQLRDLPAATLVAAAAALVPGPITSPLAAAMLALGTLATATKPSASRSRPSPPSWIGSPPPQPPSWWHCSASAKTAPGARLRSQACYSMLCGSSPIQASSGKTIQHRLNRGGDRQANAALYRVVLVRLGYHQPTKDYLTRRLAEGKSKNEIIRCLKRYIAREVFAALQPPRHQLLTPATRPLYERRLARMLIVSTLAPRPVHLAALAEPVQDEEVKLVEDTGGGPLSLDPLRG
jgi:transposase